jgi:hypothetical protein
VTPALLHGFVGDLVEHLGLGRELHVASPELVEQVPLVHVVGTLDGLRLPLLLAVRVDEAVREDP